MTDEHRVEPSMAEWAWRVAEEQLASVPRRWNHAQGVVQRAREVASHLGNDGDLLLAAAAVHDIGFSPELVDTGFAALDGARWLQKVGAGDRLAALVANSAYSAVEGGLRGFEADYADFPDEGTPVRDALWYCCLTSGPDGDPVDLDARIAEWAVRYAGDPIIARYTEIAPPELRAAVERTRALLG